MKHLLPCPTCSRPLWVRIGTAGGHHTEAWPAHACVAPAPVSAAPRAPKHVSDQPCTRCGERPIIGSIEQGALYCDPCRTKVRREQVIRWKELNRRAAEFAEGRV
jgi:uncharacterized protein YbaR (Trm112 family)